VGGPGGGASSSVTAAAAAADTTAATAAAAGFSAAAAAAPPPVIDGKLDDPAWEEVAWTEDFQDITVGRCRLTPVCPRIDRAWFQHLKLNDDEALSNSAHKFNLRRYIAGNDAAPGGGAGGGAETVAAPVPRFRTRVKIRWDTQILPAF